jgi:ankyrin repeat protein
MRSGLRIGAALLFLSLSPCLGAPIHDAARQGDLDALTMLLDQGVPLEARDATGETPLLAASLAGRPKLVAVLIEKGADIRARNDRGLTPLHAAAYTGDLDAAKLLVQAGADVNDAENVFKVTPLIVAAEGNHVDVVEFLMQNKANAERTERAGYTALTRAVFKAHWETVDALLKDGAKCQGEAKIGPWSAECNKRLAELPQR